MVGLKIEICDLAHPIRVFRDACGGGYIEKQQTKAYREQHG
jgi:hypothetical protein